MKTIVTETSNIHMLPVACDARAGISDPRRPPGPQWPFTPARQPSCEPHLSPEANAERHGDRGVENEEHDESVPSLLESADGEE